ncbi:winged helix-turn-helix transcriptional regulator [Brevundimonas sp.]|uniref:winged helix-turn-helix transcriptional regulator n=1 Tax=Brevundimonas sp. TaxID=1871086 RepID=UPI003516021D
MKLGKITSRSSRPYDDACGTAHALELVGERWALLVARELMLGPRRFSDLRAALPGLSANVLTQKLAGLEDSGVIRRRRLEPPAGVQVYELTDWGLELEEALKVLGRWAARSPRHDPTLPLSAVSLMLSLRTMYAPTPGVRDMTVAFELGGESYFARIEGGALTTGRGRPDPADVRLTSTPEAVAGAIYADMPLADAAFEVGDRGVFETFADLFSLPPKAG